MPLHDQMLLLEGENTTTDTIDSLGTTVAAREVMQKALTIDDIDMTSVAISEQMEIMKIL